MDLGSSMLWFIIICNMAVVGPPGFAKKNKGKVNHKKFGMAS